MARFTLIAGAIAAAVGVGAGAFGAHALEGSVSADRMATFETAVLYHLIHALALVATGLALRSGAGPPAGWAGGAFLAGIVLFSGSLYLLVLTDTGWLGAITPIGGVAFIAGWILLAWSVYTSATPPS